MTGKPLALAQRATLAPLLAGRWRDRDAVQATLADPWFANLYLFRKAHDWRWLDGDWPCIGGHAYDGTRLLLPLFDLQDAPLDSWTHCAVGCKVMMPSGHCRPHRPAASTQPLGA